MTRGVRVLILALAVGVLLAGASPHRRAPQGSVAQADSLPRCYDLAFGAWVIGSEPLDMYQPLPTRIALTSKVMTKRGHRREYWGVRWPTDSLRRVATWQHLGADTIAVRLPSWWSTGLWLAFTPRGDTLVGRAEVYVDYSPMEPTFARVTGVPVACPVLPRIG